MYFMEAALGQFGQVGPLQVWVEMLPAAVGVGVAMVIISMIVAIYYNVIMAYCLFYLFNSFSLVLPWTECDPNWSDDRCYVRGGNTSSHKLEEQCVADGIGGCLDLVPQTSEEQFWERKVLDIRKEGLGQFGDLGEIKMDLAFYLLLSWIVVLLCLAKGIKSSGKAVYFTATFPYLFLLILLVMGLTLPGAEQGLYYLFVPKWDKLASLTVWRRAASQVRKSHLV
jgi:solute carrier family 6 amino acid transporter-like protein 5/7/9/14